MATAGHQPGPPRVLVPLTTSFAVRYVVRTGLSARLTEYCQPVLGLTWDDPALAEELRADGAEVVRIPSPEVSADVRNAMALVRATFEDRLRSPSTRIDRARAATARPPRKRVQVALAELRLRTRARRKGDTPELRRQLDAELDEGTNLAENVAFLRSHQIDAVLSVTPYVTQEFVILCAAERLGLTACTSIISFDNLTTRMPLPIPFARYLVWNSFMVDELLRSDERATRDQVAVVGAGQFDFYVDDAYVEDDATWARRLGLELGHPIVLVGGGPTTIAPHETQYLDHIVQGIADGRLPADLEVVLRRHPNDAPERWERFRSHPSVWFDDPGPTGDDAVRPFESNLATEQITGLRSTLTHTDVHVNVSSTMTLDGAFFDKPQIGPAYDLAGGRRADRDARDLYAREHFVPIVASGGLELARDPDQLVALIARALAEPERLAAQRRQMVPAMCTFTDGRAIERIVDELRPILSEARAE